MRTAEEIRKEIWKREEEIRELNQELEPLVEHDRDDLIAEVRNQEIKIKFNFKFDVDDWMNSYVDPDDRPETFKEIIEALEWWKDEFIRNGGISDGIILESDDIFVNGNKVLSLK